ncbi:MAG: hypothetical protein U9Q90_04040 [Campylobacterota bacterium]|nr:hypothetical protein [Campylobacterota bacterium]
MYLTSNIKKIALSTVLICFSAYGGENDSNQATTISSHASVTKQDINKLHSSKNRNDAKEIGIVKKTTSVKDTEKHKKTNPNEETIFSIEETLMIEEISSADEKIIFSTEETLMIEEISSSDDEIDKELG